MYRRPLTVKVRAFWVRGDQFVSVTRLEFVSVHFQSFKVAHSVMARAGFEGVAKCEGAQRGIAASAAAGDRQPVSVNQPPLGKILRPVHAVIDIDDSPMTA